MVEFRMPSLGAEMEAGTLVEWLVGPGDRVARGDIVAVVETQKGAIEIEIFDDGVVDELLVPLGASVPVGTALARISSEREAAAAETTVRDRPAAASPPPATPPPPLPTPHQPARLPAAPSDRIRASPAARRLAQERGIDLATVRGSGPGGAILRDDVERVSTGGTTRAEAGIDLAAMRTAIGAAMARSKREIPHYYLQHQIDMTAAEAWLARANADRPPESRLLMGVLFTKAVAMAARRFPAFSGFYRNGGFEPAAAVHVGIAIAIRGGGLVAPAIHDAAELTLDELMARLRALIQRVRAGRMRSSELADPTITVSSLGERGVEVLYGVIYPPQVAILGFGRTVTRPWVADGRVEPRSIVTATLSGDHRVSDGHSGALFLAEIGRLLQEPETL
ncbi:dihydrolipoamide acetyltransferase family protein [Inquilinus sp. OTU3971]|uniref:dihydrolipoamide acetyltransferase family protein n=1 Tax=Inquilinus sp. OTU3971 TaxID=3043855 RepID=UPI00313CB8A9